MAQSTTNISSLLMATGWQRIVGLRNERQNSYHAALREKTKVEAEAQTEFKAYCDKTNNTRTTFQADFERFCKLASAQLWDEIDSIWPKSLSKKFEVLASEIESVDCDRAGIDVYNSFLSEVPRWEATSLETLEALREKILKGFHSSESGTPEHMRNSTRSMALENLIEARKIKIENEKREQEGRQKAAADAASKTAQAVLESQRQGSPSNSVVVQIHIEQKENELFRKVQEDARNAHTALVDTAELVRRLEVSRKAELDRQSSMMSKMAADQETHRKTLFDVKRDTDDNTRRIQALEAATKDTEATLKVFSDLLNGDNETRFSDPNTETFYSSLRKGLRAHIETCTLLNTHLLQPLRRGKALLAADACRSIGQGLPLIGGVVASLVGGAIEALKKNQEENECTRVSERVRFESIALKKVCDEIAYALSTDGQNSLNNRKVFSDMKMIKELAGVAVDLIMEQLKSSSPTCRFRQDRDLFIQDLIDIVKTSAVFQKKYRSIHDSFFSLRSSAGPFFTTTAQQSARPAPGPLSSTPAVLHAYTTTTQPQFLVGGAAISPYTQRAAATVASSTAPARQPTRTTAIAAR